MLLLLSQRCVRILGHLDLLRDQALSRGLVGLSGTFLPLPSADLASYTHLLVR